MKSIITIRKATKKDMKEIKVLERKLYRYEAKHFDKTIRTDEKAINANYNFMKKNLVENKGAVFVVVEDKEIIGFTAGYIRKADLPMYKFNKNGYVYSLFVEEKYREKGVGKKLLTVLLKWFKQNKIKYIFINTDFTNKKAWKFYNSYGFKEHEVELLKKI